MTDETKPAPEPTIPKDKGPPDAPLPPQEAE